MCGAKLPLDLEGLTCTGHVSKNVTKDVTAIDFRNRRRGDGQRKTPATLYSEA